MGGGEVVYRCQVGSSYIRRIFVLYRSYIKPLKQVVFIGLCKEELLLLQKECSVYRFYILLHFSRFLEYRCMDFYNIICPYHNNYVPLCV